ncbi:MAG: sigma-54 interaction domain-containing protein [Acidobacteriota bacterium]
MTNACVTSPEGQRTLPEPIRAANQKMAAIRSVLKQVAASDVPVVLRGESGVGKEVLAREIHALSPRAHRPFMKINCAALPLELLESELFGYERGAYTGAMKRTPGKFELADGGTILLDEIGDMDIRLQAKLLHFLQDHEFHRLGGRETVRVDVRVLAATHCDLETAIQQNGFREDLYFRLNVITLNIPALRDRKDEIMGLAKHFLAKHAVPGMPVPEISPRMRDTLLAHDWPGNIRELENVIRRFLVFGDCDAIADELLRQRSATPPAPAPSQPPVLSVVQGSGRNRIKELKDVYIASARDEGDTILEALRQTCWNRKRAAELLKIDYKRLLYKMKKLGIDSRGLAAKANASIRVMSV